ncbi:hypothetical protein DICPUDRAFT_19917, partial [Dictyostelium purpureum]
NNNNNLDQEKNEKLFFSVFRNIFLFNYIMKYNRVFKFNKLTSKGNGNSFFINSNGNQIFTKREMLKRYHSINPLVQRGRNNYLNNTTNPINNNNNNNNNNDNDNNEEDEELKNIVSFQIINYRDQVGSVWSNIKIPFKSDLLIKFSFEITTETHNGNAGGDGFALVFQGEGNHITTSTNLGGESIGYSGLKGYCAVEFDTYRNENEPNGNHISLQGTNESNILSSNHKYSLACKSPTFEIKDGNLHNVEITFHRESTSISVVVDSVELLSNIHVPNLVGVQNSYVGVTAASGYFYSHHRINSLEI